MRYVLLIAVFLAAGCAKRQPPPSPGAELVKKCMILGFTRGPYSYTHVDGTDFRYSSPAGLEGVNGGMCDKITYIAENLVVEIRDEEGHPVKQPIDLKAEWVEGSVCWPTNGMFGGSPITGDGFNTPEAGSTTDGGGRASFSLALRSAPGSVKNVYFPRYVPLHDASAQDVTENDPDYVAPPCLDTTVTFRLSIARSKDGGLCGASWYTHKPSDMCVVWISEIKPIDVPGATMQSEAQANGYSLMSDEFPTSLDCTNCDPLRFDADKDGDVDQSDFGILQSCFGVVPVSPQCTCFDLNYDGIDIRDYNAFLNCAAGPAIRVNVLCDD